VAGRVRHRAGQRRCRAQVAEHPVRRRRIEVDRPDDGGTSRFSTAAALDFACDTSSKAAPFGSMTLALARAAGATAHRF
jgi:hypothetical protein